MKIKYLTKRVGNFLYAEWFFENLMWVVLSIFYGLLRVNIIIRDHPFKTSANFHDF